MMPGSSQCNKHNSWRTQCICITDEASVSKSVRPDKMYSFAHMCQTKKAGIQWTPDQLSSVLYHEEQRCAPSPPKPLSPYPSHCRLSPLAALQRDGLDGANQEEMQANQYPISGYQTVYVNIIIYVQLVLFSYGAFLKYLVSLVLIVTIF